jgi:hypothetical protein
MRAKQTVQTAKQRTRGPLAPLSDQYVDPSYTMMYHLFVRKVFMEGAACPGAAEHLSFQPPTAS